MRSECWKTRSENSSQTLPEWRRRVLEMATRMGFGPEAAKDISLAVFEACANALHHGSKDGAGVITLCVKADTDTFEATVQDSGKGFECPPCSQMPPPTSVRGRGIPLMKAVMDEVRIESKGGCRITLVKRLRRT